MEMEGAWILADAFDALFALSRRPGGVSAATEADPADPAAPRAAPYAAPHGAPPATVLAPPARARSALVTAAMIPAAPGPAGAAGPCPVRGPCGGRACPTCALSGAADPGAGDARLPLTAFVGRLETLRADSPDPAALWRAGMGFDLRSLGPLGDAVAAAPRFGDALRALVQGFPALQTATAAELRVDGDEAVFTYRILDRSIWPRRSDSELTLGLVHGIARRYGVTCDMIREIRLEHAPDRDPGALSALFGADPLHERLENSIAFALPALSLRRLGPGARIDAYRDGMARLDRLIADRRAAAPVSTRVRDAILRATGRAPAGQERIAAALGLSERSLRRRLAEEGVSFQQLREACLLDEAQALLARTERPISEIAILLGYSDQTAFTRAFSRAAGCSPRAFRRGGAG